jgi:hypothetical protein
LRQYRSECDELPDFELSQIVQGIVQLAVEAFDRITTGVRALCLIGTLQ